MLTPRIEIRPAETSDAEAVVGLSREAHLFPFPIFVWLLLIWMCWIRVAVLDDKVVAFTSFIPVMGYAYLMQVAVSPSCHRRRVGTILTSWVLYLLEEQYGVNRVYAVTFRDYVVNWCHKLGFYVVTHASKNFWVLGRTLSPREPDES